MSALSPKKSSDTVASKTKKPSSAKTKGAQKTQSGDAITVARKTKETNIQISLVCCARPAMTSGDLSISTSVPFFTHMLTAMLFHGSFAGTVHSVGDVEVDPHHVVEDTGIVLGEILARYAFENQPVCRFGHALTPMDDALGECVVDFSNRAFLRYEAIFPQARAGDFDVSLAREFFTALAHNARINLHLTARYGVNSHHMLEALFKSCGRAINTALQSTQGHTGAQSTKGRL